MTLFAVRYDYTDDVAAMDSTRPEHRAFLGALQESGDVVASGPLLDGPAGALILVQSGSAEEVEEILDADPFRREGVIARREVREWSVVIGSIG